MESQCAHPFFTTPIIPFLVFGDFSSQNVTRVSWGSCFVGIGIELVSSPLGYGLPLSIISLVNFFSKEILAENPTSNSP
jgi:hypothetical protein